MGSIDHRVAVLPLKQYIEEKIDMITDEFRIYLREEEKAHFRSLKSEIEVDHYARDILLR